MKDARQTPPLGRWVVICVGICAVLSASAHAQPGPGARVEELNAAAMEAYSNLDIDGATAKLEEAAKLAASASLSAQQVAQTNFNWGLVLLTGVGDAAASQERFLIAACADPELVPDPLVSPPDVRAAFKNAKRQAKKEGCPEQAARKPVDESEPADEPVSVDLSPSSAVLADLIHVPPTEQRAGAPLPLYVEAGADLSLSRMLVHYGPAGADELRTADLVPYGDGFAFQLSCFDVVEPNIAYYVEAVDADGQVVASVGSPAEPIVVLVAEETGEEPAHLPGASVPGSCADAECPPGIVCNQRGTRAIGQGCELTSECQHGLSCGEGDVCEIEGAEGASESEPDEDLGTPKRAFVQVGFAMGFSYITSGMPVDRLPSPSEVFVDPNARVYVADPVNASADSLVLPYEQAYPELVNEWIPDADSGDSLQSTAGLYGGDCAADGVTTGPGQQRLFPSQFCARVDGSTFAFSPAVRANVGYFVTDRIAVAAVFRLQLGAGVGTLSNMLLGGRAEMLITEPRARGLMLSAFGGLTIGQIQAQPSLPMTDDDSPWIRSGLFGVHAGMGIRYRFTDQLGIFVAPELDLQVPDVLFNIDIPFGVELAFL